MPDKNKLKFILALSITISVILSCGSMPCKTNEFNIQILQNRDYTYEGYYTTYIGNIEKQVKVQGKDNQTISVNSEKLYVNIGKNFPHEGELSVMVYDKDWNLLKQGSTNKDYGSVSFFVSCY